MHSALVQADSPDQVGVSPARLAQVSERLAHETSSGAVFAASILVARQGRVVLHRGFGRLHPDLKSSATQPDTVYLLASITKPVTVLGLMLLVERGQVSLGDPVSRYLPECESKERVQVRHLLSHTSGLPDMVPENIALRRAHATLADFVAAAIATPLLYEPGSGFAYQSMGTLLAGEIIERISGKPLREFLHNEVFQPLGMQDTVLGLGALKIDETAHVQVEGDAAELESWGPNSPYWRDMGHPWGGLHSTTSDLAILMQTFLNGGDSGAGRVLSVGATAAMITDQNAPLAFPWGLGWALRHSRAWNYFGDLGSNRTFGHVGATGTVAWTDPKRDLVCVLLSTGGVSDNGFLLSSVSNMVQAAIVD